ncbi:aspartate/glutamate racemase family protein [Evansella cellulosilytica]|uniref:Aspartate racemase n=1 Tax=Evansella cellulosilytica (strain ATCC 21833 / DSM 2522 / FERM P-1141 / JCM 9156 / N-4) TaxID=649639 RepID=E6TWB4_EVAC2|nr:amino acid racemase [Evansella cellulosilytica]ADU31070.1 aspartate racemase [Evansella cellulosilytica DSM 2522]
MNKNSRTIGILGGMGPMATVDLFKKIVNESGAERDQDHHKIIIFNNPKIPSRSEAILKGMNTAFPQLLKSAKTLEAAGADFIIIPCHTAHYWFRELQDQLNIPIINMIDNTVNYINSLTKNESQKVLILATRGTIYSKIFQNEFMIKRIPYVVPNSEEQEIVSKAIDFTKSNLVETNPYISKLNNMIDNYITGNHITCILAGCTEISLLLPYLTHKCSKIDSSLLLAKRAINEANQ